MDNANTGEKAIPQRPICGIDEALIETTENSLRQLLSNIHPKINFQLITDQIDDRYYIVIALEPGSAGPYQTSDKAENDKNIRLNHKISGGITNELETPIFQNDFGQGKEIL